VSALPTTLNPNTPAGDDPTTSGLASLLWPSPFTVNAEGVVSESTVTVTSAEAISLNPLTVVYTIDPRAVWSDGMPISADDFVASWKAQRGASTDVDGSPDAVVSTIGYRDIASVVGSNGGRTVAVVFSKPFADWEHLFEDLLPAQVVRPADPSTPQVGARQKATPRTGWNQGFDRGAAGATISGGPYEVAGWSQSRMVLVRNPQWWGPVPALRRIVLEVIPDLASQAGALRAGDVQVVLPQQFDAGLLDSVSSVPDLESQTDLGTTVLDMELNVSSPALRVLSVRQAVAKSLDRPELVKAVAQSLDSAVAVDNYQLAANVDPGYHDDAQGYRQLDLAGAASLLSAAGYARDASGRWVQEGKRLALRLVWPEKDAWAASAAAQVEDQLDKAGFAVAGHGVPESSFYGEFLPSGAFDLAIVPVPYGVFPTFASSIFTPLGGGNGADPCRDWSGFDDPAVDQLFLQAAEALHPSQAASLYRQIDRLLWQDVPNVPLFAEPTFLAFSKYLQGISDIAMGSGPLASAPDWTSVDVAQGTGTQVAGAAGLRAPDKVSTARAEVLPPAR
jgi:peptide/nickel transport system substrate-binding protein